jgi:hypothetical protein
MIQTDFQQVFTQLHDAFITGVPFPDYVHHNGVQNIVSHFAINGVAPDLGKLSPSQSSPNPHRVAGPKDV